MSYWILTSAVHVILCVTVQRLTNAEQQTEEWKKRMADYDMKIKERLDITSFIISRDEEKPFNSLSLGDDDHDFKEEFIKASNNPVQIDDDGQGNTMDGESQHTADTFDPYLNMEIGLPRGDDDNLVHATVKRRVLDEDGIPVF